jgi:hypothetical protein
MMGIATQRTDTTEMMDVKTTRQPKSIPYYRHDRKQTYNNIGDNFCLCLEEDSNHLKLECKKEVMIWYAINPLPEANKNSISRILLFEIYYL